MTGARQHAGRFVIVSALLAVIVLAPDAARGGEADASGSPSTEAEAPSGLELVRLPRRIRDFQPRDIVAPVQAGTPDGGVLALGMRYTSVSLAEEPKWRVEAWRSLDGLHWERSHRLPLRTVIEGGVAAQDGSVLAIGWKANPPGKPGPVRGLEWRLGADGSVSRPEPVPALSVDSEVAGDSSRGIVVLPDIGVVFAEGVEVATRVPGGDWTTTAVLGGSAEGADSKPVAAAVTRSGFVVVAEDPEGLLAWRSADGASWESERIGGLAGGGLQVQPRL